MATAIGMNQWPHVVGAGCQKGGGAGRRESEGFQGVVNLIGPCRTPRQR